MTRFPLNVATSGSEMARLRGVGRSIMPLVIDGCCLAIAVVVSVWLRQDFEFGDVVWTGVLLSWVTLYGAYASLYVFSGLVRFRLEFGSLDELVRGQMLVLGSTALLFVVNLLLSSPWVPRSSPVIMFFLASTLMTTVRGFHRIVEKGRSVPRNGSRTVIVGAGSAGLRLLKLLISNPASNLLPVGLVDDDLRLAGVRFEGVPVVGTVGELRTTLESMGAKKIIIAAPSSGSNLTVRVMEQARMVGAEVFTLPKAEELFGVVGINDLRRINPDDLLNREDVRVPMEHIRSWLSGKRVLVTGAGGSIGSEICRQLFSIIPDSLILLDRDESALHATQLSLDGRGLLDSDMLVLADIRDKERMHQVFGEYRPNVVFHAAALKHLTLLERNPAEAWKTNVMGTKHVLEAAMATGVQTIVNISTDKAADPVSVLGMSKLVGERLAAAFGAQSSATYVSVRFGNVLGSRGSVMSAFAEQAKSAKQLLVTDPEVTRFFMTVEEAVRLTLYAGVVGESGETLVLDMGEPVKILDVAKRFAETTVPLVPIAFTGLRPGEKLHEVLLSSKEIVTRRSVDKIMHTRVDPLAPTLLIDGQVLTEGDLRSRLAEYSGTHSVIR
jgi:FlaA1/EpsC-like NDP-sugar epimerase